MSPLAVPPFPVPLRPVAAALPAAVAAVTFAWLGVRVWRTRVGDATPGYTDLARPFAATLAALAVCAVGYAATRLLWTEATAISFVVLFVVMVPWTVFALRYVGRGHLVTRRRYLAACVLVAALVVEAAVRLEGPPEFPPPVSHVTGVASSVVALAMLGVVSVAAGLVVSSTYRHRSLSPGHGLIAVLPVAELVVAVQVTRPSTPLANDVVLGVTFLAIAATTALAVGRYDVAGVRPGTGTLGERAAVADLDEAVFVLDRAGTVARANAAAESLFDPDPGGTPFEAVVGVDLASVRSSDTVACWTDRGRRQFDPRVVELDNDAGETLGYTVTLIDVTDREIRRQRIQVLNRILRHNIRNDLDVIDAHAEHLADGTADGDGNENGNGNESGVETADAADDSHVATIRAVTDDLERLSTDARRIESLMRRSPDDRTDVALAPLVEAVVADVRTAHPDVDASVAVSVPDVTVRTDPHLCRYALGNVVENALEHTDSRTPRVEVTGRETGDGVRVVVADDGPGIPEAEVAVIEASGEDPHAHASRLGLWGTNWAVQSLGGRLSFGESDLGGAAVAIHLPAGRE